MSDTASVVDRRVLLGSTATSLAGLSLVELLVTLALGVTLAGLAIPASLNSLEHLRAAGAARHLAGRCALARMEAIKRSRAAALCFEPIDGVYGYRVYVDGNGNGVRTGDIRDGTDPPIGEIEQIGDQFPHIRFGIIPGVAGIDGSAIGRTDDPIRLGRSDILTFTPAGTATPGTVYLRGRGTRQYAVRVLGATGRTRVLEYDWVAKRWWTR